MTSGAIDPLRTRWGNRPLRFDKVAYERPVVDFDRTEASVRSWFEDRLVPKVLVANQTKVIEAVVDADARMVPCTPVVSVEPRDPADLWRLAAVLTSPVATALVVMDGAGSALSADAVRLSASRLAALPLPVNDQEWVAAAEAARTADVVSCGRLMMAAYGVDDREDLFAWWQNRIPT